MEYAQKLLISKILITLAMALYAMLPFFTHVDWSSAGNVIAFPVFLYVLWGGLHGTGRSVRLVAFLGMAYVIGYFFSTAWTNTPAPLEYETWYFAIFVLLTLGVLLSIKRKNSAE